METGTQTLRKFIETAFDEGNYATDDIIAFVKPLFEEVLTFHESGLVGPFEKEETLFITDNRLDIDESYAHPPKDNPDRMHALVGEKSSGRFTVTERVRIDTDVDGGSQSVKNLDVHLDLNQSLPHAAYVPGFICFEQLAGHHDAQTDIFCLGLILGSVALGLDLYDPEDLKVFVDHRSNPVGYNDRIHPTISALIKEMTELNRSRRTQDLYDVIHRLDHYRDFDPEKQTDLSNIAGWVTKALTDKNQLVLNKLRNRLFDTSRRNRLLYYKPNMRFMNLTVSSVPMVLHYQSIRPDLLFTWNAEIAGKVKGMKEIILNKYLRFEDHLYLPSTLDKIRVESRRDVQEYGFSQLKLVITFLHWHNLREDQHERIQSPLLLIPVELKRNKKVKEDHYVLKVLGNEAEVNPVISNHLRDLYGIVLPDFVDLDDMSLEQFYELLKQQIDGANQGITLNYIDKPRIKLIHSVAKQTVNNYRKRLKRTGSTLGSYKNIAYSYQRDLYKPLGLEIFRQRIEPRATFLEFLINEDIKVTQHQLTGGNGTRERQLFEIAGGEKDPFSWDFDLCSIVLGNFNYKKMSLVRDYNQVIDKGINHPVFENLFSNLPRKHQPDVSDLDRLEAWSHIVTADPTQNNAVLQSRTGESYIIQGPPGTGKSQTITNLIADFVARGKSILFVCEKRAALDVVYHRLKHQGLDKICCYIHDSQGDKREFIRNLKVTYEDFTKNPLDLESIRTKRTALLNKMGDQLQVIRDFHETNDSLDESAGLEIRKFLERMAELKDILATVQKPKEESLPAYKDWLEHGHTVKQLNDTLADAGIESSFAEHPFSNLKEDVFVAENPYRFLDEKLGKCKGCLNEIRKVLSECNIISADAETFARLKKQVDYALMLQPLADSHNLSLIDANDARSQQFEELIRKLLQARETAKERASANINWISKFTRQDAVNALLLAERYESSFFSFLNGPWRNLKKQLRTNYDFTKHAVKPSIKSILENLKAEYDSLESISEQRKEIQQIFSLRDMEAAHQSIMHIRTMQGDPDLELFLRHPEALPLINRFALLHPVQSELDAELCSCLYSFEDKSIEALHDELESIALNAESLDTLLPALRGYAELPDSVKQTMRHVSANTREIEAIIAAGTLDLIYLQNKKFKNTDQATIESAVQIVQSCYKQLLKLNADFILASVGQRFLNHLQLSTTALSQLNHEQKQLKKAYNEGRRILENEFGKSMRYKSIRELSDKESGLVLKDLKPVWLMSPLSVSDSLPLDKQHFDVIIFDEASQITLEEGIPSLYRAPQTIIVGDEKQMPPSNYFTAKAEDPDDLDAFGDDEDELLSNDADSLLVQGARKLNSVMLGWHYRSRYETLISYSNHAFYNAALLTIPDKTIHHSPEPSIEVLQPSEADKHSRALSDRSISFHYLPNSVYEKRINPDEANYIAHLVKDLLQKEVPDSIGIVAFSQEQQHTIEDALVQLASTDKKLEQQLEEAYNRTEEEQFVGLFVKNLENVQGDERDIIIMSVCYGFDSRKKMIMNFGPINKKGGEKRLNVIFSRAKKHMAIVSSIRHFHITNEYNEGANYFKRFLHYAELISEGNTDAARAILDGLVINKKDKALTRRNHIVVNQIRRALQQEGYEVDSHVGQSDFRSSLAVKANQDDEEYTLSILVDDDAHYNNGNLLEQYYQRPAILRDFGWRVIHIFTKDWVDNPKRALAVILKRMKEIPAEPVVSEEALPAPIVPPSVAPQEVEGISAANESEEAPQSPGLPVFERLEFSDANSNKFWEVAVAEHKLIVRFGRIGTKGQTQIKSFSSEDMALREKERLVREKKNKGYS